MYGSVNTVKLVYQRSILNNDAQSRVTVSQFSHDSQLFDFPTLTDSRSSDGGGSLGGAALALLFGCGWLRRRKAF